MGELIYFSNIFVALFVIIDPFAVVPTFLTLTERFTDLERRAIRHKASIIAWGMLVLFAIFGLKIFNVFGITLPAFKIAGGILLLTFGISQLNAKRDRVTDKETEEGLEKDDISIFPLATPLLAGPGAISTVVLYSTQGRSAIRVFELILAITLVMVLGNILLRYAPFLFKLLGRTGLNLITRIMGIILSAIAVQFIVDGCLEVMKLGNAL